MITDADADLEETVTYFSQLGSIGADLPLYYDLRNFESLNGRQIVQDIIQPWINGASGKGTTDWLVRTVRLSVCFVQLLNKCSTRD